LIVDDNQPMRELLKVTLAGVAEVVGECSDGGEALAQYRRLQPDWVVMDVEMRDVDGVAATRQIVAAYPLARIVIVSNHGNDDLRRAARDAGARWYVVKEDLVDILEILTKP
jgi:two-component system chemotaxis response regulator CheY